MSRCSLNAEDALDWLLTENRIAKSVSNMRELLFLSPLNIELGALIVIVVMSMRAVLQGLLVVDLLSLREPCASGLSPPVIEIEEHVIQVLISVADALELVEMSGDVAHLVKILGADLTDVKIDHMVIVGIDLGQLLLSESLRVEPVLDVNVLMREDNRGVTVVIPWGLTVIDL